LLVLGAGNFWILHRLHVESYQFATDVLDGGKALKAFDPGQRGIYAVL